MQKLRILMLVANLRASNGVTSFAVSYFRQLNHEEVQMDFALLKDWDSTYYKEIHEAGGKIFILPSIKNLLAHIKKCNQILAHGHYDVVSDNSLILTIPMMMSAKHYHVPVRILHSHNTRLSSYAKKEKIEKAFLPILKSQCTDFCACGKEAGKFLFGGKNFTIIPNVISPKDNRYNSDCREQVRKQMNVSDRIVIGTVGRTAPQKNPYFAVNVVEALTKKVPNLTYWWIGSGEMDHELRDYVREKRLEETIRFLGSRNDILDLYQAMDIFFLPSLFEGLPLTGVEAQAFGLPCVVSASVTDEMVYTDLVKYVSLQDSIDAWVEALEEQIKRIPERRSYTEELKKSQFSAEGAGERLEKLYRDLLTKNIGASHS